MVVSLIIPSCTPLLLSVHTLEMIRLVGINGSIVMAQVERACVPLAFDFNGRGRDVS